MPTNDERREVAKRIREMYYYGGIKRSVAFYEALNDVIMGQDGFGSFQDIADRLAELIEPEERTCRAGVFPDGAGAYVICCTECGYAIGGTWSDLDTARRMARAQHKFTNFCPNCGAKVLQE